MQIVDLAVIPRSVISSIAISWLLEIRFGEELIYVINQYHPYDYYCGCGSWITRNESKNRWQST
jgi:hypothetical protein